MFIHWPNAPEDDCSLQKVRPISFQQKNFFETSLFRLSGPELIIKILKKNEKVYLKVDSLFKRHLQHSFGKIRGRNTVNWLLKCRLLQHGIRISISTYTGSAGNKDHSWLCWGSVTFWCGSGSAPLTNRSGSGSNSGSDSFLQWFSYFFSCNLPADTFSSVLKSEFFAKTVC